MAGFGPDSPWQDALRALEPLFAAERERGNRGRLEFGDSRDNRPGIRMEHPLDLEALKAQFDFGPGIDFLHGARPGIQFQGPNGYAVFSIGGGEPEGFIDGLRRRRWWRKWESKPRQRQHLDNPFSELTA